MKRILASMVVGVFTAILLLSPELVAAGENGSVYPGTIIGTVISVGQETLTIQQDITQTEYILNVSPDRLKEIHTGYRVEAKVAKSGKVSSLFIIGVPMQAQPEPKQKWKVIKYPEN